MVTLSRNIWMFNERFVSDYTCSHRFIIFLIYIFGGSNFDNVDGGFIIFVLCSLEGEIIMMMSMVIITRKRYCNDYKNGIKNDRYVNYGNSENKLIIITLTLN